MNEGTPLPQELEQALRRYMGEIHATPREREVFSKYLRMGTREKVAEALGISTHTVKAIVRVFLLRANAQNMGDLYRHLLLYALGELTIEDVKPRDMRGAYSNYHGRGANKVRKTEKLPKKDDRIEIRPNPKPWKSGDVAVAEEDFDERCSPCGIHVFAGPRNSCHICAAVLEELKRKAPSLSRTERGRLISRGMDPDDPIAQRRAIGSRRAAAAHDYGPPKRKEDHEAPPEAGTG